MPEQYKVKANTNINKIFFDKDNRFNINSIINIKNCYLFPSALKVIINESKLTIQEIISHIEKQKINIINNGEILFSFPIGFFINLYGYKKTNNKITIPLNFKMFFSNIIFNLVSNNIDFLINCNFTKTKLDVDFKMNIEVYETEKLHESNTIFQYIQEEIIYVNYETKFDVKLIHNNLAKGFFINADLNSISNIKFLINSQNRFDYNEILLNTICTKINDNLFYIPFDINEKFDDCNELSYVSSLNLSRIENVSFHFTFLNAPKIIKIYTLTGNYLNENDIMALKYKP
jgi:hypothetical protein